MILPVIIKRNAPSWASRHGQRDLCRGLVRESLQHAGRVIRPSGKAAHAHRTTADHHPEAHRTTRQNPADRRPRQRASPRRRCRTYRTGGSEPLRAFDSASSECNVGRASFLPFIMNLAGECSVDLQRCAADCCQFRQAAGAVAQQSNFERLERRFAKAFLISGTSD
jgi:hypothetical protein